MRWALLGLTGLLLVPAVLPGQGVTAGVSGLLGDPGRTQYGLGWLAPRLGPFEAALGGTVMTGHDGRRAGAQLEIDGWRSPPGRLYGVASLAAGVGDHGAESPWAAWSVGAGFRLLSLGQADFGVEARYLHLERSAAVLALGVRLAARFGGRATTAPQPAVPLAPAPGPSPSDSTPPLSTVRPSGRPTVRPSDVVQTAVDAMGSPYLWGGSGTNGFDCSGLIQYAYGRHGIALPRRSQDQARAGILVPRDLAELRPGDILIFSAAPGGPVSHVGLYVGERRFIHSASDGVRLSLLNSDDPTGRHWWTRWVGARRVLPQS